MTYSSNHRISSHSSTYLGTYSYGLMIPYPNSLYFLTVLYTTDQVCYTRSYVLSIIVQAVL